MLMPVYTYRATHTNQEFRYTMTTLEAALKLAREDMERKPHQTFQPVSIVHGETTYNPEDIRDCTEIDEGGKISVKIVEIGP